MASSTVRKVFDKGTDAFNAHDMDAMGETMTDDVTLRGPGNLELSGREAVKGFYKGWIDACPDARVDIKSLHVLDDAAIEEGVFSGTHRATLRTPNGDIPPTGRSVRVEYVQVLKFRGDKIFSFHPMYDRMELMEQLGLAPSQETQAASGWQGQEPTIQPH